MVAYYHFQQYSSYILVSRGRRGRDRMVVGFITMQSVPITTNVVSSNPSRYNI